MIERKICISEDELRELMWGYFVSESGILSDKRLKEIRFSVAARAKNVFDDYFGVEQ